MDERELDIIKYNVIGGAERQRASGLILTPLQTAAPLVARLIEENAAQSAEIERLRAENENLRRLVYMAHNVGCGCKICAGFETVPDEEKIPDPADADSFDEDHFDEEELSI